MISNNLKQIDIMAYFEKWLDQIKSGSPLIKRLMNELRSDLSLDQANKKELEQVMLIGLISVL
ncbi:hypothetical protein [Lactobacillus kefiranofaciens]|uniref:hypothetical protein n=1 Tax=Lactobacillus kefiranofaciens TaxID=267818 RepID=UPI00166F5DD9|nr:hypothetical protein [Lactobacillus kefiranofaciens]MCJ2172320.1 hypothetical protein [Lactobacillus kefiranofaciens]QNT44219.1 hypothetical protein ICI50_00145 [Lactobacillus kefiranofaciens]